jgi:Mg-chelatase subunit ChlD
MTTFNKENDRKTSNLQSNEADTTPDSNPITPFIPTANPKIQHLIILDASGSMESIKQATITGFNEVLSGIIQGQQLHPELHNIVSLVVFNSYSIQRTIWMQPISSIHPLNSRTYLPNGGTPLFDAIGVSVTRLEEEIGDDMDTKVVVNIITDGYENASHHFNREDIRRLVDRLTEKGWIFSYIGANQDAMYEAESIHIKNHMNFRADAKGVKKMYRRERYAKMSLMEKLVSKSEIKSDDYYKDIE